MINRTYHYLLILILLGGCGIESETDELSEQTASYSIGGTITGLNGDSFIIQNNASDDTSISQNGEFSLLATYSDQSTFNLAIAKHPENPNQICRISQSNGKIDGESITNIDINCVNTYPVGGELFDLNSRGSIFIENNGEDTIELTEDGTFQFTLEIEDGQPYEVRQSSDMQAVVCTIVDGTGTIDGAAVSDVKIYCDGVPGQVVGPDPDVLAFQANLWSPILRQHCSTCHAPGGSGTGIFADPNVENAHAAANSRIDRSNTANSLLVTRVRNGHMCWMIINGFPDCNESANAIETAIDAWITANL